MIDYEKHVWSQDYTHPESHLHYSRFCICARCGETVEMDLAQWSESYELVVCASCLPDWDGKPGQKQLDALHKIDWFSPEPFASFKHEKIMEMCWPDYFSLVDKIKTDFGMNTDYGWFWKDKPRDPFAKMQPWLHELNRHFVLPYSLYQRLIIQLASKSWPEDVR